MMYLGGGWPNLIYVLVDYRAERIWAIKNLKEHELDLMDLLKDAGADAGVGAIARQVGLSSGDTGKLLKAFDARLATSIRIGKYVVRSQKGAW
jgi:hypothetical protein